MVLAIGPPPQNGFNFSDQTLELFLDHIFSKSSVLKFSDYISTISSTVWIKSRLKLAKMKLNTFGFKFTEKKKKRREKIFVIKIIIQARHQNVLSRARALKSRSLSKNLHTKISPHHFHRCWGIIFRLESHPWWHEFYKHWFCLACYTF